MTEYWSNNDRGYRLRLWIDQTGQSTAENYSNIRVRLALLNTTTTFAEYNCNAYVDLAGQRLNWSGRPSMLSYNQTIMLIDQTIRVNHDSDGKKTFGLMAHFNGSGGYSPGTLTVGSSTFRCTDIARASSISDMTGTLGSAMTININRKDSSFTHTVKYNFGALSGTIATGVGTSVSWTPPLNLATAMPKKTSDWGNITVDTYNGSNKIGSATCRLTLNVPESMKPTFSGVTLSDTNTVVSNIITTANTFVEILSNVKVAFSGATGVQGSTITGYRAEMVGENQTVTSDGGVFGLVKKSGEVTIRSSVQDSRGRWSDTKDTTVEFLEYTGPTALFIAERSGSARNTLTVTRTARISPLTVGDKQLNQMTVTFKTRPMGGDTWTTNNGSASGVWTTQSELIASPANLAGTFSGTQSWEVMMTVSDLFTTASYSYPVSTDTVLESKTKDGIGIGKIREHGALDVAGEIYANNKPIQHHQLTNNDGRSPYNASGTVDLNTKTVNSFFSCNEPINGPTVGSGANEFYVSVYSESDNYLSQQAIQKNSGRMFTRTRHNGTWTNWIEYALKDELKNQINTGWQSAGYAGSYYKRSGDVLAIRFDFKGNGNTFVFAEVPPSVFSAPQSYMIEIAEWSNSGADTGHVQVNAGTGQFSILASKNNQQYRGQILLMV
ncbi:capsid and scaffold protein [Streptococcus phage Javan206]|uniref:Capsid and scaffold protein n=3 Tax=Streptococcus equinus TaxID=1335 RepID=A0A1I4FT93_STREI|nr:DUF859 domain-containing protein [Streptococcus equinus]QBX24779.1 capsid and scaffold protein [Streptococcus phage Javan206]SFL20783.1 virus protein of unknown function [Streptococcus equinus JB1]